MTYTPEETQKLMVPAGLLTKVAGTGFWACATVIAWVGTSLINRVDSVSSSFNTYVVVMEKRVSTLEESQRAQNEEISRTATELRDQRRK